MTCGCAGRREWIRRKFSQWANPFADFTIANEAPGKSAQGAWIKSTEGARGFGGNLFLKAILQPSLGKTTCWLSEQGDQDSFYSGGLYEFHAIKPDETTFLVFSTFNFTDVDPATTFPETTGPCNPGGVDTPNGFTTTKMSNGSAVTLETIDRIDVRLKSDGSTVRSYTGLVVCRNVDTFRDHYHIP